jgi:hypothetical protein
MLKRNPSIQVTKRLSEEKRRGLREISAVRDLLLSQAPFAADVVGGMLAVSRADVERGMASCEARKQAA